MATDLDKQIPVLEARLDKARHVKYWTRCLKTLLPNQYTGNDSNRMYLAFFILSALDLLEALQTACQETERQGYLNWIYRCHHPNGGFRMWPGTDFGDRATESNAKWDPANVPATYFALAALLVLGDDLQRVKRKETLNWLRQMQRQDGSFGETLVDGHIEGGSDPRFGYCATGIRYILRGTLEGSLNIKGGEIQDVNVDALVRCIRAAESYDGGIADELYHEPHAGYTFCSLGTLAFVHRLKIDSEVPDLAVTGPVSPQGVLHWLAHRQTDLLDPDADLDSEFIKTDGQPKDPQSEATSSETEVDPTYQSSGISAPFSLPGQDSAFAGMNGRLNKVADTCYAWWVCASLHILNHPDMCDRLALQKYLLEKTQHPVLGGFGKFPGDLPDLYHSYLGLAALSLAGSAEVKKVDGSMCISQDAKSRLSDLWKLWGIE